MNQDDFKETLRLIAEEKADGDGHLTPAELLAYHCGEHQSADESRVQEHLVCCHDCTEILLDISTAPELDCEDARRLTDADLSSGWAQIQKRLPTDLTPPAPQANVLPLKAETPSAINSHISSISRAWRRLRFPFLLPYAVAASLLIATFALAFWVSSLRRENQRLALDAQENTRRIASLDAQLSEREGAELNAARQRDEARRTLETQEQETTPRAPGYEDEIAALRRPSPARIPSITSAPDTSSINLPPFELYPEETLRGASTTATTGIKLPRDATRVSFTLNTLSRAAFDSYRLAIVNRDGETIWSRGGLRKNLDGNFTFIVPRRLLPAGGYSFQLYGQSKTPAPTNTADTPKPTSEKPRLTSEKIEQYNINITPR